MPTRSHVSYNSSLIADTRRDHILDLKDQSSPPDGAHWDRYSIDKVQGWTKSTFKNIDDQAEIQNVSGDTFRRRVYKFPANTTDRINRGPVLDPA